MNAKIINASAGNVTDFVSNRDVKNISWFGKIGHSTNTLYHSPFIDNYDVL